MQQNRKKSAKPLPKKRSLYGLFRKVAPVLPVLWHLKSYVAPPRYNNVQYRGGGLTQLPVPTSKLHQQSLRPNYTNNPYVQTTPTSRNILKDIDRAFETKKKRDTLQLEHDIAQAIGGERGIVPQVAFDAFIEHKLPSLEEYGVFAHGQLITHDSPSPNQDLNMFFTVPKDTAIVYVTMPGLFGWGGSQQRDRKSIIENARRGRATSKGGYLVMYTEGSKAPNNEIDFNDNNGAFGGITGVFNVKTGSMQSFTQKPVSIQSLLKKQGPGVYYVVSCRSLPLINYLLEEKKNVWITHWEHEKRARELQRKHTPKNFDKVKESLEDLYRVSLIDRAITKIFPLNIMKNLYFYYTFGRKLGISSKKADPNQQVQSMRKLPDEIVTSLAYLAMAGQMVGLIPENHITIMKGGSIAKFLHVFGAASTFVGGPRTMNMLLNHTSAIDFLAFLKTVTMAGLVIKRIEKFSNEVKIDNMVTNGLQRKKVVERFLKSYGLKIGMPKSRVKNWWWKQAWRPNAKTQKAYELAMKLSS
jgi:hypothetical protein